LIGAQYACWLHTVGPIVRYAGYGQPLAWATVLQPVLINYHFRGYKAPLSSIVSGAISLPLT